MHEAQGSCRATIRYLWIIMYGMAVKVQIRILLYHLWWVNNSYERTCVGDVAPYLIILYI